MDDTAFPSLAEELGRQVREARLDAEAFRMPLKVCELAECRATCCHDGVFLSDEERRRIEEVVDGHADAFAIYGVSRSGFLERRGGRVKTATRPAGDDELAERFPPHFPRTRCVFLDDAHRCGLQRFAAERGEDPWRWKPFSCWMHPLLMRRGADGRPLLTLARPGNDPAAEAGYPGFGSCTPCGMEAPGGEPAWRTLRDELERLGRMGGRDLVGELRRG